MNMADKIFRVEVPQKTVTQIKGGRKQEREEIKKSEAKEKRLFCCHYQNIYVLLQKQ